MTLYTVPGTGYAQLLINSGDGPTMVLNRDETNQLYVGDDNSVASKNGTGDIDIIDPLSYIVYDGVASKWGICAVPNASIQVDCVKGATNWAPSPAQAAQQISLLGLATATNQGTQISAANLHNAYLGGSSAGALISGAGRTIAQETASHIATGGPGGTTGGVPLLNYHRLLQNFAGTVPAGSRITLGTLVFSQPGWSAWINLEYTGAAASPFGNLQFRWQDQASGNSLWTDSWFLAGGNSQSNIYVGKGQALGNQVVMQLANQDLAQTLIYNITIWQTSQINTRQDIRLSFDSPAYSAPSFTVSDYTNAAANVLGQRNNAALAAGAADGAKLLPVYSGKIRLFGNTSSNTSDLTLSVNDAGQGGLMSNGSIAIISSSGNGQINTDIYLPRSPCTVQMVNHNAAAQHCQWYAEIDEY